MAITLRHIIADIKDIASSGSNPNEFKIPDEQIAFWIAEIRSKFISQAIQKRQDLSDIWIQVIGCLELELVDESECCEADSGCYVLRSTEKLPPTIETLGDNTIISVQTVQGISIQKTNKFKSRYKKYNKYTKTDRGYYLNNGYLYVINDELLKYVTVYLLAEDPQDLEDFANCDDTVCFSVDSDYPVSMKMASDITDIVIRTKVLPFLQLPADNTNDAQNATQQPPNKIV